MASFREKDNKKLIISSKQSPISPPSLRWQEGIPVSDKFDDPYYSIDDGAAESRFHFLGGNNLPNLWQHKSSFTIGETGFGTGLNLAITLEALIQDPHRPQTLTFFTCERYPLPRDVIRKALTHQAIKKEIIDLVVSHIPPPLPGFHIRCLGKEIRLVIFYGDVEDALDTFKGQVDAWFLDGFAPRKNPQMWSQTIINKLAKRSVSGARFATFTAAAAVRRGLISAGFSVQKAKGFGRKKERLIGYFSKITSKDHQSLCHPLKSKDKITVGEVLRSASPRSSSRQDIAIIGAGIAGLSLAWSLREKGINCTLYDRVINEAIDGDMRRGSTTPVALLAPSLPLDTTQIQADIIAKSFAYACDWLPYQKHFGTPRGLHLDAPDPASFSRLHRMADVYSWGQDWFRKTPNGLWLSYAGGIETKGFLSDMKSFFTITAAINTLQKTSKGWELWTDTSHIATHSCVVIAAPARSLLDPYLPNAITKTPGRTGWYPAELFDSLPNTCFMRRGYLSAKSLYANQPARLLGATRDKTGFEGGSILAKNLAKDIDYTMPDPTDILFDKMFQTSEKRTVKPLSLWSGVRAETRDRLPLVGPLWNLEKAKLQFSALAKNAKALVDAEPPIEDGLYCATGFGSRGFQYAPYMMELLACTLAGDTSTISPAEMKALHPGRLIIKSIIKSTASKT